MASNDAARSPGSWAPRSRRQMPAGYRFLSPHQAAVLDAAIRCLNPQPEEGVHVVTYLDRLLSLSDTRASRRPVRAADVRDHYTDGIALLDELADGDFTAVPRLQQDLILSHIDVAPFASLLFDHIVEAIYAPLPTTQGKPADRYHDAG